MSITFIDLLTYAANWFWKLCEHYTLWR